MDYGQLEWIDRDSVFPFPDAANHEAFAYNASLYGAHLESVQESEDFFPFNDDFDRGDKFVGTFKGRASDGQFVFEIEDFNRKKTETGSESGTVPIPVSSSSYPLKLVAEEKLLLSQLLTLSPPPSNRGPIPFEVISPPPIFVGSSIELSPLQTSSPISPPTSFGPLLASSRIFPSCPSWRRAVESSEIELWHSVVVSYIVEDEDPSSFFLQCVDSANYFQDLVEAMNEYYCSHVNVESDKRTSNWSVGDVVAAKFSEDDQWYRAFVRCFGSSGEKVRLLQFLCW